MKAAVIGLGVEGKKAVTSLLNHGWEVYATDLNINVDLNGLNLPVLDMDMIDEYIKDDKVKGIICVPMYANPNGISYSENVIKRFLQESDLELVETLITEDVRIGNSTKWLNIILRNKNGN